MNKTDIIRLVVIVGAAIAGVLNSHLGWNIDPTTFGEALAAIAVILLAQIWAENRVEIAERNYDAGWNEGSRHERERQALNEKAEK